MPGPRWPPSRCLGGPHAWVAKVRSAPVNTSARMMILLPLPRSVPLTGASRRGECPGARADMQPPGRAISALPSLAKRDPSPEQMPAWTALTAQVAALTPLTARCSSLPWSAACTPRDLGTPPWYVHRLAGTSVIWKDPCPRMDAAISFKPSSWRRQSELSRSVGAHPR